MNLLKIVINAFRPLKSSRVEDSDVNGHRAIVENREKEANKHLIKSAVDVREIAERIVHKLDERD